MNLNDIKRIENVAGCCSENLLLVSSRHLLEYARDRGNPRDVRRTVVAELVARWCVSGNSTIEDWLREFLPDWTKFVDWYQVDQLWSDIRAIPEVPGNWREPDGLPGLEVTVRNRLARLFRVDGFIPVYDPAVPDSGLFIPFELESAAGSSRMRWTDGSSCPMWCDEAEAALAETDLACRLQMSPIDGVPPDGSSLMLPLLMASWRRDGGHDFPRYDVLRVLATGKIANGRLASVGTKEKLSALRRDFRRDAVLIGPDAPGEIENGERSYVRLDVGTVLTEVREMLRSKLEASGLSRITWRYARGRLPDLKANVDRLNRERWCDVADHLLAMREKIRSGNGDVYLDYLALSAVALCHAGRTEEARAANREAYEYASERHLEGVAIRLQIEAMVDAQDMGDLDEFMTLREDAEERLARFAGPERDDLMMRFNGTMAQAETWGVLLGWSKCSRAKALHCVQMALDSAVRISNALPSDADARQIDEAESNVQQDRNYRHLWSAVFEPGTASEKAAYDDAILHLNELQPRSRQVNVRFLLHQKSLALFNAWRETASMPALADLAAATEPLQDTEGWLVAANRAHLGVLHAAAGELDVAKRLFQEGDEALPQAACWAPVLGSIRFVFLVRAALALSEAGDLSDARHYDDLAHETYAYFGESKLFKLMRADRWLANLESGVPVRTLPAFYY